MELEVRRAEPEDASTLKKFQCAWPKAGYTKTVQSIIQKELPDEIENGETKCFLGFFGDELVGLIAWIESESVPFVQVIATIDKLSYRQTGIASALVERLVHQLSDSGYRTMAADADANNVAVVGLFEKVGAKVEKDPDNPDFVLITLTF